MRTPLRLGTLASAAVLLILIGTIFYHSDKLRDQWGKLDSFKGSVTDGISHWGHSQSQTTSIDPKYIGFGTPTPSPDATQAWPTPIQEAGEKSPGPTQDPSAQPDAQPDGSTEMSPATEDNNEIDQSKSEETSPDSSEAGATVDTDATVVDAEKPSENDGSQETDGESGGDIEETEDDEDILDEIVESMPDKIVVMAKTHTDDTSWVGEELTDWQAAIYSVDDEDAVLKTPMNKGKEAMAYLTYIIENYGNFPSTVAFVHSHQDKFWHSDGMPARSNMIALKALRTEYVQEAGFTNLRCALTPGCPAEVQPFREHTPENLMYERNMSTVWELFFPSEPCPEIIAAPCCAQFAVSRNQIMARPIEDYLLYREWLMKTEMNDENSGRVFEYLWHIIFGQEPVFCPEYGHCWMNVYGGPNRKQLHTLMYGNS
ncbi:uncharacterized protein BKA78DRAFT_82585 [Phyllosticta capitalensis]|uniref:uncharacterized protein n=1 Tax=Phyllosticta capitalensis TaxID=121624 RepID=UPI00312F77BA